VSSALVQARHVEILATLASAIARSNDLDSVLEAALAAALSALDLPAAGIFLVHEETGELRATSHHRGVPEAYVATISRFRLGEGPVGEALLGETPVVVPDLSASESVRDSTRQVGLRSGAFVPLFARGRAVGVLTVGGYEVRAFAAAELHLLAALGGMVGAAVDNARLMDRVRRHLAQVQALSEIDRALIDDRALSDVLPVIAREAALLGRGDAVIALIEGERGLRIAAWHGERARAVLGQPPTLAGTPVSTLLLASGPITIDVPTDEGAARALVVPLAAGGRTMGGLIVVKAEGTWSEEDASLLATFGRRAAVALAKARAREAEGRRAGQLAILSAASEIAASTLDVDALLGSLARYLQRSFGYYSVAVYLVEPEVRSCTMAGAAGMMATLLPKGHRVPFGTGIVGWVAQHGQYVLASDVRREPRFHRAGREATLSELAVPVRLEGEVVAVINLESDRLDAFDEGDVVAVDGIAAQVASAIRNARLYEEKVRALRSLEILQEITNVLNSDLDLDALIGRIARSSVEAVRAAQMGAVLLFHEDGLVVRASFGYPRPDALASVRLGFHEGLPGSVFVSGQGRLVRCAPEDYAGHEAAFREAAGGADRASALCVPIALPQEKLGVLLLESAAGPDAFEPADLRFASTLAHQAAIAIGNALRMQRIVEMDRQRQDFLSNVSHELRSPLTVIQGYVEALGEEAAEGPAQQYVAIALEHCDRLGRMIDEVLDLARLEKGVAQQPIDWSGVRLADCLRTVLKALRAEAAVKGVTLDERIEEVPPLPGDERLLRLLLHHLVENAVKFTRQGGRVEVALGREGDDALFLVRDDGIGIAREHHERIFEKFYAVDAGRSRAHDGAGIGLYLAREVVHIHAGVIRVASASGQGALFEVRLPLRPLH
jgi:signal transduction histidine kinase/putative methionine-R-sulfoxide reductase with GAF domain